MIIRKGWRKLVAYIPHLLIIKFFRKILNKIGTKKNARIFHPLEAQHQVIPFFLRNMPEKRRAKLSA
jgi:hypothetical protein